MGCTRKRAVLVRKGAQYTLPSIDLTEEQTPGIPKLAATITSMHDMQLQMFATIQEMQTKINELHASLKTSSRNNTEKETKWIEDAIGEVIYDAIEKTKYLADEHLMKICYDMLSDIKKVEFQNNVVGNAILTKMSVQLLSGFAVKQGAT
ncbi:hypothetical protein C2G38_2034736 [Gigaspora rosea]|uniref:Uncharacterized protein n=1 Tax=Gigaspora rosea TaxID=44941 RepID=A0A397VJ41_9GLOM|nr:hypothetical protein C2G38_2034736 [Gigaspora rosea]